MINRVIDFLRSVSVAIFAGSRGEPVSAAAPDWQRGHSSPASEDVPVWDADDRGALLAFLRSPTGRVLLLTLRHNEELLKSAACDAEQSRVDHARGRAVGYREAIASLILLSAPEEGVTTAYGRSGNDAAPDGQVEDFVASPPRGAGELREQLSHEG